ncbi:hypothetical protein BCR44DRAFT_73271 [Catenaria anguillulae PL171]|uniref:EF-hand domain-containing protein n=1 Tax=Catenaria anguillulae PL171 TaxID=765915 RepID=A0A1Y2HTA1_9FUNG|nr:hypothetical protein BCR44DRAFT_73271 [Catenaria anguillulae PL171]
MSVRIGPTQDASGRVASATLSPISPASSGGTVVGVQSPPSAPKAHIPKKKRNRAKKSKQRGSYTPPNADAIALKDRTAGADKGSSATLDGKNQGIVTKLIKAVRDVIGLKDEVQDQWERAAEDAEPALDVAAAVTGIPEIAEFFPAAAQIITGFLDAIASSVPGAQPFVMCAKLLLKYGEAYCKHDNAAGELCRRVVFVLQATANLYQKDWQVDSRAVEWVLTNLNSVIEQCCVFFKANDTRGKVAQFFYAKQTLAKIEAADKRLAHAMEDLKFILLIDSRQQSIKRAEALAHHFKNRCKEQQYRLSEAEVSIQCAIETKGGVDAVQQRPDLLAKIAEGIPGVECVTERDLQQLKISFDDCCADVKRAMTTVLDKLDKQSLSISQIDSQIKELAERGSVFKQIKCHTIRALWVKSGWGARVKVAEFMDVIMEEMRFEVETELGHLTWHGADKVARVGHVRGDETAPRRSDVQTELSRRFQYFSRVLRFMDADGSGTFSPSEVNDFFIIPEWSLLDYFRLVALYIPKYEYEQNLYHVPV